MSFVVLIVLAIIALQGPGSARLWQEYIAAPDRHPNIPNVSYSGYRYSDVPIPVHPPEGEALEGAINVKDFGAVGDGRADDTEAFLRALATTPNPGWIFVPEGTYRLTDMLRIHRSNLVLFGAGSDKTTLYFEKSLTDILGPYFNPSGRGSAQGNSLWSLHGGLIWVTTADAWRPDGAYRDFVQDPEGDGEDHYNWKNPRPIADVIGKARTGDRRISLQLRGDEELPAGLLLLTWHDTQSYTLARHMGGHLLFDRWTARAVDSTVRDYSTSSKLHRPWRWPVEIKRVLERQGKRLVVQLKQPLRIDIRPEWKVALEVPGTGDGSPGKGYVEEVGIEGLRIEMAPHKPFTHLQDLGFNGPYFDRAFNCWVRDVVIHRPDVGISVSSCKNITIREVELTGPPHHHGFYVRNSSHDILIERFQIKTVDYHGLSIARRSSGCVFRDGFLASGTFDSHKGLPFDVVRTNITLSNEGTVGGGPNSGPRNGKRIVHWNIRVLNGKAKHVYQPDELSMGALVGVQGVALSEEKGSWMPEGDKGTIVADHGRVPEPADLFEAQLRLRRGQSTDGGG
ncbi:MAG: glycosyl hydrolase family 28-related protein [Acidobacteriota bacterium]